MSSPFLLLLLLITTFLLFFQPSDGLKGRYHRPPRPKPKPQSAAVLEQDFIFTTTSPKLLHPGMTKYPILLSLERSSVGPIDFDFVIKTTEPDGVPLDNKTVRVETIAKASTSIEPETSILVEVELGAGALQGATGSVAEEGSYNLTITGRHPNAKNPNDSATDYAYLYLERKTHSILIQTDKPIYKPGETVQYRVLFLTRSLLPAPIPTDSITISIFDSERNIVKCLKGEEIPLQKKYGLVRGSLSLSKEPNLGSWNIEVVSGGDATPKERSSHPFTVEEYILPKFKVELSPTPTFLTYNASSFRLHIKSSYTHGKGVSGPCNLKLRPLYEPYYGPYDPADDSTKNRPHFSLKTIPLPASGEGEMGFDLKKDLGVEESTASDYGTEYIVEASCTEEATGKMQNASISIKMYRTPWKIEVVRAPPNYKPGFNLSILLKVSRHDGSPVEDPDPTALQVKHGFSYEAAGGVVFAPILNGLVSLTFVPPTNELLSVTGMEASYRGLTQWLSVPPRHGSETGSYMMLTLITMKDGGSGSGDEAYPTPGTNASFLVRCNKAFGPSINWLLLGKGKILGWSRAEAGEVNGTKEMTLSVPLPVASSGEEHLELVVYTVLPEKDDVIAESLKFKMKRSGEGVGKGLKINVGGINASDSVEPGSNITLSWDGVLGDKDSALIGLRAIDQSVLLLREDKNIDEGRLRGLEEEFQGASYQTKSWGGSDIFQVFERAGISILSNGRITKNEYLHRGRGGWGGGGGGGGGMVFYSGRNRPLMKMARMEMMEDAAAPVAMAMSASVNSGTSMDPEPIIRNRKSFPETWIFTELPASSGVLHQTVPDTITSWVITAFQLDPLHGLGISSAPAAKLTVFRPFFLVLDLPYSTVQGETLALKVLVYNYLGHPVDAKISLENKDGAFILEAGAAGFNKTIPIPPNATVATATFLLSPTKIGHLPISVRAVASTNEAGDSLTQMLLVKPPGVRQQRADSLFINLLKERTTPKKSLAAVLPPNRVASGDSLKITVIGDILGSTIQNLDSLIRLPTGCGEQTMLSFVPDVIVLDYLKSVESLSPNLKDKATRYLELGYQRELSFKRWDGGYSAFGNSDPTSSTWLTAFVVRSFLLARRWISIDPSVLAQGLQYLERMQREDGSFLEEGYVHDKALQGGSSGPAALTAFTLLAFVEGKSYYAASSATSSKETLQDDAPNTAAAILDKGLSWLLRETSNSTMNTYAIILTCYLLHLLGHPSKEEYFTRMQERMLYDGGEGYHYWEGGSSSSSSSRAVYGEVGPWSYAHYESLRPASVEITGYALLIHLIREKGAEELKDSLPIGRWLLKQRNELGGFLSTQDTVVGLSALGKLASLLHTKETEVKVRVSPKKATATPHTFYIGASNASVLQEYYLPEGALEVEVEAEGKGSALLVLSWSYYTMGSSSRDNNDTGGFELELQATPKDKNRRVELRICTAAKGAAETNMVIVEVNAPSGYAFDKEELLGLKKDKLVKRFETEERDAKLNVYFSSLSNVQSCLEVKMWRTHFVAKHAKSSVSVYDYYDTTRRVTKMYEGPKLHVCEACGEDNLCRMGCEGKDKKEKVAPEVKKVKPDPAAAGQGQNNAGAGGSPGALKLKPIEVNLKAAAGEKEKFYNVKGKDAVLDED